MTTVPRMCPQGRSGVPPGDASSRGEGPGTKSVDRIERLRLPERKPLIGSSLGEAERELAREAERRTDLLSLMHADTQRFPPPEWALDGFISSLRKGLDPFTPCRGSHEAREAIAPALSAFIGIEIDSETELALTPGTQAALFCTLAALVEREDVVMLVDPDYLSNERTVRFLGGRVRHVDLSYNSGSPVLDFDQLEYGFRHGARLLMFSHPNNPTGAVFDAETIGRIAQLVAEYDALVIADELYSRFLYDDEVPFPHLANQPGMRERCITTLGPSKTESMSGFRIGCLVAPEWVVSAAADVLDITAIRASAYSQYCLRHWLTQDDAAFVRDRIAQFRLLRDTTVDRLSHLESIQLQPPQATAYLFPDVSALGINGIEAARALLNEAHVIVNPGISFGPGGSGSFRMCFAQDERVWPDILDTIVATLESCKARMR